MPMSVHSRRSAVAGFLAAALCLASLPALAASDPRQGDIPGIRLGMAADALPDGLYADFACGTDGGPPGLPLRGWTDFVACPPEAGNGLHEVTFHFDDELEYIARAREDEPAIDRYSGTKLAGFPVVLSLLFDDGGTVRGMRIITDSRAGDYERRQAYLFGDRLMTRYGRDGWACTDLPLTNGEEPVGRFAIKRHCEKVYNDDRRLLLDVRVLRHAGQTGVDPASRAFVPGAFESSTRLEIAPLDGARSDEASAGAGMTARYGR
jgi:hypothetical protein